MQVTRVSPFLVQSSGSKNWLFVKVETDSGLVGWGEAYTQLEQGLWDVVAKACGQPA
jgi:galactonate dehydratase